MIKIDYKKVWNFILRNSIWILLTVLSLLVFHPGISEIKTMLLIVATESVAIALSGISLFVFTKIDFTKDMTTTNPGLIFLGVHICTGLTILGVYLAQFGN